MEKTHRAIETFLRNKHAEAGRCVQDNDQTIQIAQPVQIAQTVQTAQTVQIDP